MKKQIIPAIIASNQEEMEERINKVKDFVEVIQLDVMDGKFVPTKSLDFKLKLPDFKGKYEAHLMISDPESWIEKNYEKVDCILIHYESAEELQKLIDIVRNYGKKVGIVVNPETTVEHIKDFLDQIDQILIMTVNPGFYGSKFLPETLDKVREIRKLMPELDIEVDGGINDRTIGLANEAGANLFDSGSFIVKADDSSNAIDILKNKVS